MVTWAFAAARATHPLEVVYTYAVDGETGAVTVGPGGEVHDVSR